jgi:hypothetical protein
MYSAYNANQQNKADAQALNNIAQPLSNAGNKDLSNYLAGALTPAQNKQYQDMTNQGNALVNQAKPMIDQATQGIAQATSGQLPSWQQTQLDNATAAAIAQLRSSMGANVDSSTMAQMEGQIRQQAQITAGQLEQQNLQTYETLYSLGATTQKEAFALLDAANQSVLANLQQDFSNSISAFAGSNTATMDRINAQMAQDKILSDAIGKIVNGMTNASGKTALDVAGGKVGDAIKYLFGGGSDSGLTPSGNYTYDYYQSDAGKQSLDQMLNGEITTSSAASPVDAAPVDAAPVDNTPYDLGF